MQWMGTRAYNRADVVTNWQLVTDSNTEDLNCGDTGYVGQGRSRVYGTTMHCLGKDSFYAFSAIEMKVIVVGPGLDIIQFIAAWKVIWSGYNDIRAIRIITQWVTGDNWDKVGRMNYVGCWGDSRALDDASWYVCESLSIIFIFSAVRVILEIIY